MSRSAAAVEERVAAPGLGQAARAMARTGGASLASSLLSLTATKILASVAGPPGVALMATLQHTRQAAVAAATLNGQTALVKGASARDGAARRAYVRTVLLLFAASTAAVAAAMILAPQVAAGVVGLGVNRAGLIRWLAAAVVLSSGFVFLSALLNALGEIGKLAALQLVSPLAVAILAYPAAAGVRGGDETRLAMLLGAAAFASCAGAWKAARGQRQVLREWFGAGGRWWNARAAATFFSVSGSMLTTGLIGSLAVLAARSRILQAEGLSTTGRFDAAWSISMNHVTLVLASMQTCFLPALARARDAAERSAHVSNAAWMAALIATPVIAAIVVAKPWVLSLLFSADFSAGARFLRWTLVGDYLKVASWILSLTLVAAGDMKAFVAADLAAYGVFSAAAWALAPWTSPAEAAAQAFLLMYATHLAICYLRARSRHGARPSARATAAWAAGCAVTLAVSVAFWEIQ